MSQQYYPDMLGVLATEHLLVDDVLQCALGLFPQSTVVGQPIEALLLLQSLIDQPLPVQLTIKAPPRDTHGNLLNVFTPRPRFAFNLPAGETGLLHVPVVPELPTEPGSGYPIYVHVAVQKPDRFGRVRPLSGGPPPSLLAISPFRVTVLRDVHFVAQSAESNWLGVTFDVLTGRFPPRAEPPAPRYEALWTVRELAQERARTQEVAGEALRFARGLTRTNVYAPLLQRTRDVFGDAGLPLHPGEILFITKLLTYVMEDGLELEQGASLVQSFWFQRLCGLMASDPTVLDNVDQLIKLLYSAVVQDAVLLGFKMVTHNTGVEFGDEDEQNGYAARVVGVVEGRLPASLEHIYVPLAMAGTMLVAQMTIGQENPWQSLAALQEARDGRTALAGGALREVFDILNQMIAKAEQHLHEMRISRE